mmetsp:Transcript_5529/g.10084  ORF Transcript_5529/g.10084 Transcript_5529/m.10084 type:complete len:234 (-) Transcript_5529:291-992(-)
MTVEPTTTSSSNADGTTDAIKNVAPTSSSSSSSSSAAVIVPSTHPSIALPPNRFELELEFVQSLASPAYLHYLATSGTLYQQTFLDFLRYLRYWKEPQYAKYLLYPHCLYFLDLLVPPESDPEVDMVEVKEESGGGCAEESRDGGGGENGKKHGNEQLTSTTSTTTDSGEAFRREMAQLPFRNFVHEQQFYSWQFRSARLYGRGEGVAKEVQVGVEEGGGDGEVRQAEAASAV